ncbi:MAG: NADP-dependent malic enzyme, partial [Paramuribaculum sp.]|nr:NADP-dependent malic enzyme [Paramuribaculum sp.]
GGSTAINEAMKLAAVHAIADLAKLPVPPVVNTAYDIANLHFGRDYILPKPLDPRLLTTVAPAVARGAMESGVATRPITDWDAYDERLRRLMGYDNKLLRRIYDQARSNPRRVVFGEANTDKMLKAAVIARKEGVLIPILLGNEEMIAKRARKLGLDIEGIEIINLRHDREAARRGRYAKHLYEMRQRQGVTQPESQEKMFDRNYFGMMMVEMGDADAFLGGTYAATHTIGKIAEEVVGIRPSYSHFAAMHIFTTKLGTFFLADTQINKEMDEETLYDIARLTRNSVEYFAHTPVMAMLSYSNFGSADEKECRESRAVAERMKAEYPELLIDGEMSINFAINTTLRDKTFPFNKLRGHQVNTLIFPNISASSTAYRTMLELGVGEAIGPIQMGLNKPIHYISVNSPVRNILNLAVIAAIDAQVMSKGGVQDH